jgi:hypothetical protein
MVWNVFIHHNKMRVSEKIFFAGLKLYKCDDASEYGETKKVYSNMKHTAPYKLNKTEE